MEESAGTPFHDPKYFVSPFILNTDEGRYLVLKAIKLCNVRTIDCMKQETSCVLKVDKPQSPCPISSSDSAPKCYMQQTSPQQQRQAPQLRFINTGALSNLFANTTDKAARVINQ
ncbi:DNA-binding protein [Fowlpox virus]|uniref:Phosphoprotein OPG062 n=5 Tax=Avipoxvirus TaxID=10260 RepID=PG062_FOWPN|nr:DNA-binding protein [Fowlpox virus]YP_009046100.1 DNA-binding virion core phosphoprotein [Penguinpox virus]YP_009046337.1 DNA-binding virion core phosphoprotein [Pigeonpox virus]YP_009448022.1 DNA binding virion core phosphoprotein [Flamingopox virus FGPVKD09]Q9J5B7.1 RecName: Full=Phosphoprotein OPG062; AltName: Full=Phosphoprotein F17 [Fowlpox virus strain NVSL]UNS14305.1 ALPV-141 [Albatrosspox virus]WCB86962.1 CPPV151 DNA-binding protein [Cooks petrelpox virus]WIK87449.1 DNA-binding vi